MKEGIKHIKFKFKKAALLLDNDRFTLEPLLTVLQKLWKVFWKFIVWTIYIIHLLRKILNVLSFQWIMMGLQSIRDKSLMPRLFNKENSLTNQGYSIVWTVKDLFIEIVRENEAFWEKLYTSKFFFKRFVTTKFW